MENNIVEEVCKLLIKEKLKVAVAESCTGGMISSNLVSYPGISEVFLEGAVTYSNEAKMRTLQVKQDTLKQFGAVSEQTAKEMAEGVAKRAGADVAVSTTGIAGPGGGTKDKPVGLVYIGVYCNGEVKAYRNIFVGDRMQVREKATMKALELLKENITK